VTLHPPCGRQKSWYVYWAGLGNAKSTGHHDLSEALATAEQMLRNGGERLAVSDGLLTDEELTEIQRAHFHRKHLSEEQERAKKSLTVFLEALDAFVRITELNPVTKATADDCARFQRTALELPKSWRLPYRKARKTDVPCLSPNTILKWSRSLQAAFQRANIHAGRKCVRGIVPESKLLTSNPWNEFTWIEGKSGTKRQFSDEELLSILDYFEQEWHGVHVAALAAKTSLWAWARVSEMSGLKWDNLHSIGNEAHFEIIGKWGVEKWARLPNELLGDLRRFQTNSDFVFAAYVSQLRDFYAQTQRPRFAALVAHEFSPGAFKSWFQDRIDDWAKSTGRPHATPHAFRRTSLQHARSGEDINRQVAQDAKVSEGVMLDHYVSIREQELRQASNRTFERIVASLSPETARRYGHKPDNEAADLERRLEVAKRAGDWRTVQELAAALALRSA